MSPPIHLVLLRPEIAPNTGNVGRMCAVTGCVLHLVRPLGFRIDDAKLRRAGMDYWRRLDVREHDSFEAFLAAPGRPERLWLFTTSAPRAHWDVRYLVGDGLVFGCESAGASPEEHAWFGPDRSVKIPQYDALARSLNLSTACGVGAYEALRQIRGPA
ncbi:MAG: tRNA (cytidine(34)-2'-O)-methyltransferase [Opitutales bacterium]